MVYRLISGEFATLQRVGTLVRKGRAGPGAALHNGKRKMPNIWLSLKSTDCCGLRVGIGEKYRKKYVCEVGLILYVLGTRFSVYYRVT